VAGLARTVHGEQVRDDHAHAGTCRAVPRRGVTANCLWPATLIATAAVQNIVAGDEGMRASRRPEIMADAAATLLLRPAAYGTAECYLDEEVLRAAGRIDLSEYPYEGATEDELQRDLFL
jgi:citronellol/citronellal dehydrogenase